MNTYNFWYVACQILGKGFLIGMIVHLVVMLFVQ